MESDPDSGVPTRGTLQQLRFPQASPWSVAVTTLERPSRIRNIYPARKGAETQPCGDADSVAEGELTHDASEGRRASSTDARVSLPR